MTSTRPTTDSRAANLDTAAFDFDGTLTTGDTLLPFLRRSLDRRRLATVATRWLAHTALRPSIDRRRQKERILTLAFSGLDRSELEQHGAEFAHWLLQSKNLRPDVTDRLEWHRDLGHRLIIVSASVDAYLQPLADALDVELACTRLEYDDSDRFTGRFAGRNCRGQVKVERLLALGVNRERLWAYGNSEGDRAMLEFAARGERVDGQRLDRVPEP